MMKLFFDYWFWHYFQQPSFFLKVWRNFLILGFRFFSIPLLLKTFLAPYRRYSEKAGRGFDFGERFSVFFSNLIFRAIGALVRSFILILGFLFEIFVLLFGIFLIIFWFFLPLFILFLLFLSFWLIF